MEVVVKVLESGLLEFVPIPGLAIVARCLVKIWRTVQDVSVSCQLTRWESQAQGDITEPSYAPTPTNTAMRSDPLDNQKGC